MSKTLEARVTPKVMKWFRKACPHSAPFEIKHTHGLDRFSMLEFKVHQRDWLKACNSKFGCIWKIPDSNMGYNPFDGFFYKNSAAYVIIVYPKDVIAIHIAQFIQLPQSSLHIDDAKKIARFKVLLCDII